jgi:hypothetical protein
MAEDLQARLAEVLDKIRSLEQEEKQLKQQRADVPCASKERDLAVVQKRLHTLHDLELVLQKTLLLEEEQAGATAQSAAAARLLGILQC